MLLQIEVKERRIAGLGYWVRDHDGHQVPQYLPAATSQNPLIQALALESVQLFIGAETQHINAGWYPASADLVNAVNMLTRLQAIGGAIMFVDTCNMLPRNELARLLQAVEVIGTWINGSAHIYTCAAAIACVKTAAARRGLLDHDLL